MFFYEVEGHMQILSSLGRVKNIRPKKSLTIGYLGTPSIICYSLFYKVHVYIWFTGLNEIACNNRGVCIKRVSVNLGATAVDN